jgi:hypothetical protein
MKEQFLLRRFSNCLYVRVYGSVPNEYEHSNSKKGGLSDEIPRNKMAIFSKIFSIKFQYLSQPSA